MIAPPEISPLEALALVAGVSAAATGFRVLWRSLCRLSRANWAKSKCSFETLRRMHPNDFEKFTAAAFEARGWHVDIVGREGQADGGLDLLMTAKGRRVVVQCKRWSGQVGVSVVREAVGVMFHHHAQAAYVVALSGFTRPAMDWAKGKPIRLINGHHLMALLRHGKIARPEQIR